VLVRVRPGAPFSHLVFLTSSFSSRLDLGGFSGSGATHPLPTSLYLTPRHPIAASAWHAEKLPCPGHDDAQYGGLKVLPSVHHISQRRYEQESGFEQRRENAVAGRSRPCLMSGEVDLRCNLADCSVY
jgi:hypothetical protein